MANKRIIPRERRRCRVEIAGKTSFTIDLSPGGMCVESMKPQPPGTSVSGKLRMGDRDIEFAGIVCWAVASDPRVQLRGRMGIRFIAVAPEYFHALAA